MVMKMLYKKFYCLKKIIHRDMSLQSCSFCFLPFYILSGGVAKRDVIQGLWLTFTIDCNVKLVDDISVRLHCIPFNFNPMVKVIDCAYKS